MSIVSLSCGPFHPIGFTSLLCGSIDDAAASRNHSRLSADIFLACVVAYPTGFFSKTKLKMHDSTKNRLEVSTPPYVLKRLFRRSRPLDRSWLRTSMIGRVLWSCKSDTVAVSRSVHYKPAPVGLCMQFVIASGNLLALFTN